ncbi:MAG TPA: glycosyltransferase family 4 protein [Mycobacteriales bacterium]|nr:glycosyltransferase family 4 protein [Mycobacteriales bacterium]
MRILATEKWTAPGGGMERSMLEVAEGLAGRGHDLELMYRFPGDYLPMYASFGVKTHQERAFFVDRAETLRSTLGLALTTLDGVRRRPDLIYLNDVLHVPFGAMTSAVTRAPAVSHLRLSPPDKPMGRQFWKSVPRIKRFIAVSADTRDRWVALGFPADRVGVVHNGVDVARYTPGTDADKAAARSELGIADEDEIVLYLGRIDKVKGIETLIDAVNRLAVRRPRLHLLVVGRPAWHETPEAGERYVESLRTAAKAVRATFLAARLDAVPLYRVADVVAMPSEWPEPFGRVAIEAMACGRPCVATRIGGIPEIFTGDLEQLLTPAGDPAGLATCLDAALDAGPELGGICRAAAQARFSLETALDGIEANFGDALR